MQSFIIITINQYLFHTAVTYVDPSTGLLKLSNAQDASKGEEWLDAGVARTKDVCN